jgi:hypothetical protein
MALARCHSPRSRLVVVWSVDGRSRLREHRRGRGARWHRIAGRETILTCAQMNQPMQAVLPGQ